MDVPESFSTTPDDDLFNRLSPELQEGVASGALKIVGEGQQDKPVVVDASTGKWVKGSGRPLNANDPATVGKMTGYKRSKAYNEAIEQMIPAWEDGKGSDAVLSFESLIKAAHEEVVGRPEFVDHECSGCGHTDRVYVGRKRDNKVLMFLIERLAGAANKTQTINLHSEELVAVMHDQRVLHSIEVVSLTPEERAERARLVMES